MVFTAQAVASSLPDAAVVLRELRAADAPGAVAAVR